MASNITVNFRANTAGVQGGINKLKSALGGLAKAAGLIMAPLAAIGGAAAFTSGVKNILSYGGRVSDLANRTGLLASEIVVLEEAFRQAGLEGADVATTLQKLSNNVLVGMQTETSQVSIWMKKFGITLADFSSLNMAQQFELISSKIGALASDTNKAAAAAAFFGMRQGALLVNLFKTNNAMDLARTTVGGLGVSMDKWAAGFDYIDDMLGAIPIKVKQFFAAFVGNNIEDFKKIADIIQTFDSTNLGTKAGLLVATIRKSLDEGNFPEVMQSGLIAAVKSAGELLVSLAILAGQMFTKSMQDTLEGTELGRALTSLGLMETKQTVKADKNLNYLTTTPIMDLVKYEVVDNPDYKPVNVQSLEDIRKTVNFGAKEAWEKAKSFIPEETSKSKFDAPDYAKKFMEEFSNEFQKAVPINIPDNFKVIPKSARLQKIDEKKGNTLEPFKPVLSSLQKVGGAAINFTRDPLVALQKTANGFMKETAQNTTQILSKMGDGASFA